MANIFDMVDVWNDAATTFTSIKMNTTDTASNAASLLMDLQVGGVSKLSLTKEGSLRLPRITGDWAAGTPSLQFIPTSGVPMGFEVASSGSALLVKADTSARTAIRNSRIDFVSTGGIAWTNSLTNPLTTTDLLIARDAANTLAQRNGVNAQAFNLYNTYTDASNYERGFLKFVGNELQLGAEAAGTGTARNTRISGGNIFSLDAAGSTRFNFSGAAGPFFIQSNQVRIANFGLTFCTGTNYNTTEFSILRDDANTLAQRNGVNAQTSRIYGTFTDASNYRRLALTMSSAGVAEIKPEGAGTGETDNVLHISGLPTSNPGPGILWNNAGTVEVGT